MENVKINSWDDGYLFCGFDPWTAPITLQEHLRPSDHFDSTPKVVKGHDFENIQSLMVPQKNVF